MDPALIAAGATAGTAGGWLLARLAEPSVKEIGDVIAAPVKRWAERRKAVLERAGQILRDAGVEPRQVPDDVWAPLLQHAALVDDEAMQVRWAALLAAAADPRQPAVPPSFPRILAELSPADARVLEAVYATLAKMAPQQDAVSQGAMVSMLPDGLGLSKEVVTLALENLWRLRLISPPATALGFIDNKEHRFQLQNLDIIACGTELGWAFVNACGASQGEGVNVIRRYEPARLARSALGTRPG